MTSVDDEQARAHHNMTDAIEGATSNPPVAEQPNAAPAQSRAALESPASSQSARRRDEIQGDEGPPTQTDGSAAAADHVSAARADYTRTHSERTTERALSTKALSTDSVTLDVHRDSSSSSDTRSGASGTSSAESSEGEGAARASFKGLFRYASKWDLFFNFCGLIAACAAGAAQPIMTIVFGNLTTTFLSYTNAISDATASPATIADARAELEAKIREDALYLVYVGIAMFGATYIYMATWVYTGEEVTRRTREAYLSAVLRQEIAYFDVVGPGEITTRIQNDVHLIQEGISDKVPMSMMFVATFIAGFIVAYSRSWQLSLAMSSILPCILGAGAAMNVFVTKYQQIELQYVAQAATVAEEALSTVRTAKAFAIEERLVNLYDKSNAETTKQGRKKAIVQGMGLGTFFFVIYASYALAFFFGSKLLAEGKMSSGTIMNVIFSIFIGAFSLAMLAPNLTALSYAMSAGAKIFETIDRQSSIDPMDQSGLRPEACHGDIECRGLYFRYPARPNVPILENFNLSIPAGKSTALVGASGSGKSTIIGLLERYYDANQGQLLLDGHDTRNLNITWLRTQMGYVAQEPSLFSTTIRENIEYGLVNSQWEHADVDEKKRLVEDAAKQANAHDFITQLPKGYETLVGERGFLLSGGQKQRIAIARAIVKRPKILLLDEATSALDTQSEGVVQEALDRAAKGRTTIIIAHRLSTIKKSDKIVVMGKGVILEQGSHEELLSKGDGAYFGLVDAQRIRGGETARNTYDDADVQLLNADKEAKEIEEQNASSPADAKPEMPHGLMRHLTGRSVLSTMSEKGQGRSSLRSKGERRGLFYLLYRLAMINKDKIWTLYVPGIIGSVASGAVYPAFSVLFGRSLDAYSLCSAGQFNGDVQPCPEPFRSEMRSRSDDNALYFFIISLLATLAISVQNGNMILAASILMERLRHLTLQALLRADVSFFDEDENSSGSLTSALAENSQRINGLVGVML